METKHTPGPWEQGTQVNGSTTLVARMKTGFVVAEMRNVHFREEAEANARLIAAAPDLLESLRELAELAVLQFGMPPPGADGTLQKALAAIAKADGDTTWTA